MGTIIMQRSWRWIGHGIRKENESITKTALHWTHEGRRKRGRPKKYMATYSRDRIERLKKKPEKDPTAGQSQTEVEELRCCPTCQWA